MNQETATLDTVENPQLSVDMFKLNVKLIRKTQITIIIVHDEHKINFEKIFATKFC